MNSETIGVFIAALRKEQGITQSALAQKLNINNRTVSKWENGDGYPDITILPELASALGVTVDELLAGERKSEPQQEIHFDITYTKTAKQINESQKSAASVKIPFNLQSVIIVALCVCVFSLTNVLLPTEDTPLFNIFCAIILCSWFLLRLLVAMSGRANIRAMKNRNGGNLPISHIVFSDKIYTNAGCISEEYAYSDITAFIISKNVYTIRIYKRMVMSLPKDAFGERQAEFEEFMRGMAPSTVTVKTSLRQKITAVVLIILTAALALSSIWTLYTRSEKYFYHDIEDKSHYFYQFEKEFNQGVKKVRADKELMSEAENEGYTDYWAENYLNLERIYDAEITPESVTFDSYNGALFYSGYIYYEGEGLPWIDLMNFEEELVDKKEHYIKDDSLYLFGRSKNGSLSSAPWYIVKPLSDNWYYYELHIPSE